MRVRVALDPTLLPAMADATLMDEIFTDQFGRLWTVPSGGGSVSVSRLISFTKLTATGAGVYTLPVGILQILVEIWSAGGGGGGATTAAVSAAAAAGGGGGGYSRIWYPGPNPATFSYLIGVGGVQGSNAGTNGSVGGASQWDTLAAGPLGVITLGGGAGGQGMLAGTTPLMTRGGFGSGLSGVGGNNLDLSGEQGGNGIRINGTVACNGKGGQAAFGSNGGLSQVVGGVGQSGDAPGSGGGGGLVVNGSGAVAGGAGTRGQIIIWEFGP